MGPAEKMKEIFSKGSEREHREVWGVKMGHHQLYPVNSKTAGQAAELMAGSRG